MLDQALPEPRITQRVEVRRITIAPGVPSGPHIHNGPVFGSIETGSAVLRVADGPQRTLAPGDVFYEPEAVGITRFDAGPDGVTFLAYFPLAPGESSEITFL